MKEKFKKIWGFIGPVFKVIFGIVKMFFDFCFLIVLFYGIICVPLLANYKMYVIENENNEINYKKGTVIYYKKVAENEIYEKDVIVYQPAQEMIFHKVLRVINPSQEKQDTTSETTDTEVVQPKGYHYEAEIDSYHKEYPNHIAYGDLLGKVAPIYLPYVGYFVNFIQMNMPLFYIILGISAIDLLLSFLPIPNRKQEDLC